LTPQIMGVVNVTPDSFSDGGRWSGAAAVEHGARLVAEGADLLDVGGEATNPRAAGVTAAEELARVIPVIEELAKRVTVPISIDTTKAEVARAAVAAGARIINDVSGGLFDDGMPAAVRDTGAVYICGHLRGRNLAEVFAAEVAVTVEDVIAELRERVAGFGDRVWVDPGLGFGKGADPAGNLSLLAASGAIGAALGRPVVVGPSRKRFLARLTGATTEADLDAATVGACLAAAAAGANIVRVHNVSLLRPALVAYSWIERGRRESSTP
jgi:dihydropteroate synthase